MGKLLPWTRLPLALVENLANMLASGDLTPSQALLWVELLALTNTCARESRGLIANIKGEALSVRAIATRTGMARGTVRTAIKKFKRLGWVERGKAGSWSIRDFETWTAATMQEDGARGGQILPGGGKEAPTPGRNFQGASQEMPWQGLTTGSPQPRGEVGKTESGQMELHQEHQPAAATNVAPAGRIDVKKTALENNDVVVGDADPFPPRQRPGTGPGEPPLGAVAGAFACAVGRPLDPKDAAVMAELNNEGYGPEEITRAVEHFGRIRNAEMRRAGLRYCAPMIRKGLFKPGAPVQQSGRASQVPSGNITVAHTPDLIAQRRAKLLALQNKTQDVGGSNDHP